MSTPWPTTTFTSSPTSFRTRAASLTRVCHTLREVIPCKENVPLPEKAETVIDLWCEGVSLTVRGESGGPVAEGKVTVAMLAKMEDGQLYYFDKTLEVSKKFPWEDGNALLEGKLACQDCAWSFSANDTLEVRCDLEFTGTLSCQVRAVLLDEVQVDEKAPREDAAAPGLYLYLADPEETLWDIAKRYNTNMDKITGENPEETEGRERRVLLIPVL